jgi:hypothetical protein
MKRTDPSAVARVCHEANRALQIEQADPTIPISPCWDELDEETRQSAIQGVTAQLRAIEETGRPLSPEASHEEWVHFKLTHGWTLGPVKDETLKQHPLLVAYEDLPAAQQVKDRLFASTVLALAPALPAPARAVALRQVEEVLDRFRFHPATHVTGPLHTAVRLAIEDAAVSILDLVPPGRHQSLALTALQEAMMWSNAGIACDTPRADS